MRIYRSGPRSALLWLLVSVIAVSVLACGSEAQPTSTPPPTDAPVPADTPEAATAQPAATPAPANTPAPQPTAAPTVAPMEAPAAGPTSQSAPVSGPAPTATPQQTSTPQSTATPVPTEVPYPAVPGIVDPSNQGWPREIETVEGRITLDAPPQRVLTYSLGHDEILLSLLPSDRIAAIGKFTGNEAYSNVADRVEGLAIYEKGAENVLAQQPDLFIASKTTKEDIVNLIEEAGVPVARPSLENSSEGNIPNILLYGYMLGVEDRALELVAEIRGRLATITEAVPPPGDEGRPDTMSITRYSDTLYVSGGNTTVGGIMDTAGGTNTAARDGIEGIQKVSLESVAALNPEVIFITQSGEGGESLRADLLAHPALAEVPAIVNGEIHVVGSKQFTTLSHWNVRGIEVAAQILYPDLFVGVTFADFEAYHGE